MERLSAEGANADQITYWNSETGQNWARDQVLMDALLAPMAERLMELAHPTPGERVLDIGCGCGATTFKAAQLVGHDGRVTGVDISEPMLAWAKRREIEGARPEFVLADAATAPLGEKRYDLAISRFGVMFFADPVAAFKNIHASLKPDGRLAFVCWQTMKASSWFALPFQAALSQVQPPEPPDPDAPGPFAFADSIRIQNILHTAGYHDVVVKPVKDAIRVAGPGPNAIEDAVRLGFKLGPASRLLENATEEQKQVAREKFMDLLKPHVTAQGIYLDGAIWLVSART